MSEAVTPEIIHVPGLNGLVSAFRSHAATYADGTPAGTDPAAAAADEAAAQAYAHAAACLETHLARLAKQNTDRLNGPDLRARLALTEDELRRTRERLRMAEHHTGDMLRAALELAPETPIDNLGITSVITERAKWRNAHDGACALVAKMHAAAMGGVVRGPVHGVAEDVWYLRVACEALAQAAGQYLERTDADAETRASLRVRLSDAQLDACNILRPTDADEHNEPIDTVNAIADVLAMRGVLARIAAELVELPRLPAGHRSVKREQLVDLAREYAGAEPYPHVQTRAEILLDLLHDAWGVIANAGLHRGNWDHEHPEWVTAAERWRDRFHAVAVVVTTQVPELPEPDPFTNPAELLAAAAVLLTDLADSWNPELGERAGDFALALKMAAAAPTNVCEPGADAARRFAGEIERLRTGLQQADITPGVADLALPADEWPVTAALAAIGQLRYERTLLGQARRLLDQFADLELDQIGPALRTAAADVAQRIVDEIGHPCTDEPALGPSLRDQLADALKEAAQNRTHFAQAADQVSKMHAAAVGAVRPPDRGMVQDVADLRTQNLYLQAELDKARARADQPATTSDPVVPDYLARYADDPAGEPNAALLADMLKIAGQYRGVGYDPEDRPTEVLAVRRAAAAAGLIPYPDPTLIRSYRGGTPPTPGRMGEHAPSEHPAGESRRTFTLPADLDDDVVEALRDLVAAAIPVCTELANHQYNAGLVGPGQAEGKQE